MQVSCLPAMFRLITYPDEDQDLVYHATGIGETEWYRRHAGIFSNYRNVLSHSSILGAVQMRRWDSARAIDAFCVSWIIYPVFVYAR